MYKIMNGIGKVNGHRLFPRIGALELEGRDLKQEGKD